MTVKQVTIENVIDSGDVIRSAKDWKREPMLASQRFEFFCFHRIVNIHGKQLKIANSPPLVNRVEQFQIIQTLCGLRQPRN